MTSQEAMLDAARSLEKYVADQHFTGSVSFHFKNGRFMTANQKRAATRKELEEQVDPPEIPGITSAKPANGDESDQDAPPR